MYQTEYRCIIFQFSIISKLCYVAREDVAYVVRRYM